MPMKKSIAWNQYDVALKQRGGINFWINDEIEKLWYDNSSACLEFHPIHQRNQNKTKS